MTPLVWRWGASTWAWAEKGILWVTSGGPWAVVTDCDLSTVGGRVCTESEVRALVHRVGKPL